MSHNGPGEGSSERSPHESNSRVDPRFFGSSSTFDQPSSAQKKTENTSDASPHYWANPPPPYSPPPNEPDISSTSDSAGPSAPPLEEPSFQHDIQHAIPQTQAPSSSPYHGNAAYPPLNYNNQHPISPPPPPPQQQQSYPPQGYNGYGAINQNNNAMNWPWIAPPSSTAQPFAGYHLPPNIPPYNDQLPKKQTSCFGQFIKFIFYFIAICIVIRVISSLSGTSHYSGSCSHGVVWDSIPKEFDFSQKGLRIRILGGSLSTGRFTIKRLTEQQKMNGITNGIVKTHALISPASLAKDPELGGSLTHLANGTTLLDITIPNDLSSYACVSMDADIYVPDSLGTLQLDLQNAHIDISSEEMRIDLLSLTTTNSGIEFNPKWIGRYLFLKSKNAHIEINEAIYGCDTVEVATTNGGIRLRKPISADFAVVAETTNSGIDVDASIAAKMSQLETSNGHINIEGISVERTEVKSTNGRVFVHHANISELAVVHTTNANLDFYMEEGEHAEVVARTTNSRINVRMPIEHVGSFDIEAGSLSRIELSDPLDWVSIHTRKGHYYGTRHNPDSPDEVGTGRLQVTTTNGNAVVAYARKD